MGLLATAPDTQHRGKTVRSRWNTLQEVWSIAGVSGLCRYTSLRAAQRLGHIQVIVGMTLEEKDLPDMFRAMPPPYSGRLLTAQAVDAWAGFPNLDGEFLQRAIDQQDECLMIFCDGKPVSWGWYSRRPTTFGGGLEVRFGPDFRYMYRGYTLPAYRGQRLHAYGMAVAVQHYASLGYRGLIGYVNAANFRSLRSIHRLGYEIGSPGNVRGPVVSTE